MFRCLHLCQLLVAGAATVVAAIGLHEQAALATGQSATESPIIAEMKFIKIPKGTFWMGWSKGKQQGQEATIENDFELAAYCVTQGQWLTLMDFNPSGFSRKGSGKAAVMDISDEDLKRFPVESVTWLETQDFLKKLNTQEKGKGWFYRLPTEAEWEYACRGAATTKEEGSFDFYLDKPTNELTPEQANFKPGGKGPAGPSLGRTAKVGSYPPNKMGLYDMHGNVGQWCNDFFDDLSTDRNIRGGGWSANVNLLRAGARTSNQPTECSDYVGFRVARVRADEK